MTEVFQTAINIPSFHSQETHFGHKKVHKTFPAKFISPCLVFTTDSVHASYYNQKNGSKNESNLFTQEGASNMPKPRTESGGKNLISKRLAKLRQDRHMSQRDLANKLQLAGYDIDKNVITRIETDKRYVSDLEIKAFADIFQVSYDYLIDGKEE